MQAPISISLGSWPEDKFHLEFSSLPYLNICRSHAKMLFLECSKRPVELRSSHKLGYSYIFFRLNL